MIIKNNFILKILSKISGMDINGFTFGEIIFVRECELSLINHEKIHRAQYRETLYIGFLIIYVWDFLKNYVKTRDWEVSYQQIRFEKEAYRYMFRSDYLETRKKYAWL